MASVDNGTISNDPSKLTVELVSSEGAVATLKITGQLDVSTESQMRAALDQATDRGATKLALDVSELEFMDSSGLAVLIIAARGVESIELHNPSAIIRRLITIAGLTDTLRMTPDA